MALEPCERVGEYVVVVGNQDQLCIGSLMSKRRRGLLHHVMFCWAAAVWSDWGLRDVRDTHVTFLLRFVLALDLFLDLEGAKAGDIPLLEPTFCSPNSPIPTTNRVRADRRASAVTVDQQCLSLEVPRGASIFWRRKIRCRSGGRAIRIVVTGIIVASYRVVFAASLLCRKTATSE